MAGNDACSLDCFADDGLTNELQKLDVSQLLHLSAANASTMRDVSMPGGKMVKQCMVAQLRDMIGARSGKLTLNKPELVAAVKQCLFLKQEVNKTYVNRNKNAMDAPLQTSIQVALGAYVNF